MEYEIFRKNSSRLSNTNHALPFELLGAVFSHISEDPLDLRYAIFVCRSWHNAIVHHANLWTNIILRHTFLTRFRGARLRHGDAFVHSCLSRSWPLPLHISIHGPDCESLYAKPKQSPLANECFSLFTHIVSKSTASGALFQRCRSLTWFCCYGLKEVDLVAQAVASASAPALECLTIKDVYPEGRLVHFPRLPRLKEVTLMEYLYGFHQPIFHDDDFAKAEKLTFIADVWADHGVNFIRRFRNIRALTLKDRNTLHWCMLPLSGHMNPVELPLLETLSLSGMVPHQMLCLVRAPGLRMMEIEADMARGRHSLTATNLVHLVRTLECLYLSLKEGEHGTSWVEELERLVAEAPVLASVCVSPWMMQYLTEKEWCTGLHYITEKEWCIGLHYISDSNPNLHSAPTQQHPAAKQKQSNKRTPMNKKGRGAPVYPTTDAAQPNEKRHPQRAHRPTPMRNATHKQQKSPPCHVLNQAAYPRDHT